MNRHGVWWEGRDEVTGKITTQMRTFATREGAMEWVKAENLGTNVRVHPLAAESTEQFHYADKEITDARNRRRMVELMLEHNITIPARVFDKWRPTVEKTGYIDGVSTDLTCIMTDGLLGYFIRPGREPLYGHVQCFHWDVPDISFVPYWKDGELKFFKQVKDTGAPSARFKALPRNNGGTTKSEGGPKVRRKVGKITTKSALSTVDKMLAQYSNLIK